MHSCNRIKQNFSSHNRIKCTSQDTIVHQRNVFLTRIHHLLFISTQRSEFVVGNNYQRQRRTPDSRYYVIPFSEFILVNSIKHEYIHAFYGSNSLLF